MENKYTAVQWLFDQVITHNGIVRVEIIEKAIEMEKKQMSECYTEGFRRKSYIMEIMNPEVNWDEGVPEDFDTYYEKTYGE